jgi:hypothetical protein
MPLPPAPTTATCIQCGDRFEPIPNRRDHCTASCKRNHEYRDPPQHAADLEALSVEFVAALRVDGGYVELMMIEAAVMLDRKGRLPVHSAA